MSKREDLRGSPGRESALLADPPQSTRSDLLHLLNEYLGSPNLFPYNLYEPPAVDSHEIDTALRTLQLGPGRLLSPHARFKVLATGMARVSRPVQLRCRARRLRAELRELEPTAQLCCTLKDLANHPPGYNDEQDLVDVCEAVQILTAGGCGIGLDDKRQGILEGIRELVGPLRLWPNLAEQLKQFKRKSSRTKRFHPRDVGDLVEAIERFSDRLSSAGPLQSHLAVLRQLSLPPVCRSRLACELYECGRALHAHGSARVELAEHFLDVARILEHYSHQPENIPHAVLQEKLRTLSDQMAEQLRDPVRSAGKSRYLVALIQQCQERIQQWQDVERPHGGLETSLEELPRLASRALVDLIRSRHADFRRYAEEIEKLCERHVVGKLRELDRVFEQFKSFAVDSSSISQRQEQLAQLRRRCKRNAIKFLLHVAQSSTATYIEFQQLTDLPPAIIMRRQWDEILDTAKQIDLAHLTNRIREHRRVRGDALDHLDQFCSHLRAICDVGRFVEEYLAVRGAEEHGELQRLEAWANRRTFDVSPPTLHRCTAAEFLAWLMLLPVAQRELVWRAVLLGPPGAAVEQWLAPRVSKCTPFRAGERYEVPLGRQHRARLVIMESLLKHRHSDWLLRIWEQLLPPRQRNAFSSQPTLVEGMWRAMQQAEARILSAALAGAPEAPEPLAAQDLFQEAWDYLVGNDELLRAICQSTKPAKLPSLVGDAQDTATGAWQWLELWETIAAQLPQAMAGIEEIFNRSKTGQWAQDLKNSVLEWIPDEFRPAELQSDRPEPNRHEGERQRQFRTTRRIRRERDKMVTKTKSAMRDLSASIEQEIRRWEGSANPRSNWKQVIAETEQFTETLHKTLNLIEDWFGNYDESNRKTNRANLRRDLEDVGQTLEEHRKVIFRQHLALAEDLPDAAAASLVRASRLIMDLIVGFIRFSRPRGLEHLILLWMIDDDPGRLDEGLRLP